MLATVPSKGGQKRELKLVFFVSKCINCCCCIIISASQSDKINIEKFCDEINQDFLLQETAPIPIYSPRKKDETGNRLAPQSASSSAGRNSYSSLEAEKRRVSG